jgi:hypothetical protein
MGFGKMEKWVTGIISLHREVKKVSMEINSLLKSTCHHSIIPWARQNLKPRKNTIILNRLQKIPRHLSIVI